MASEVFKPQESSTLQTGNSQIYIRLDAWATPLGNTETGTIRVYNSVQLHNKDSWSGTYSNPGAKVQSEIRKNSSSTATTVQWDAASLNLAAWTTVSRSYLDLPMSVSGSVSYQVSAQSIAGTTGTPTFGAFNLGWYDVTLTGLGNAQHTVAFNLGYSGAPTINSKTKVCGTAFNIPNDPTRSGYKFTGWTSNVSGDENIYKVGNSTSNTHDGGYVHDQFGGTVTLTAHWEVTGPTVKIDNNTYFKTDHDPSSGLKFPNSLASWIKEDGENIKIESGTNRYIRDTGIHKIGGLDKSLMYAPYYRPDNIQLKGFYTGDSWQNPGTKVYEVITDNSGSPLYMQQTNRTHILKGIQGDAGNYFEDSNNNVTLENISTAYSTIYSINGYSNTAITGANNDTVNVYLPNTGTKQTTMSMPKWEKSGNGTITLYALWSKPDLKFTYHPNGGSIKEEDQETYATQTIADPGQASPTLTVKLFSETRIKPPVGEKFVQWTVDQAGNSFSFSGVGTPSNIPLGGYLLNTTLYAQYTPYLHKVILHANSYEDEQEYGENAPAFFPQLQGRKTTNEQTYKGGVATSNLNYRGQPWHPDGLKFLGYYTQDDSLVYAVNKNLRHTVTWNNETYILNPAKAVAGAYFSESADIDLPTLDGTEYEQIRPQSKDTIGYKWAYTGNELETIHLYAKWAPPTNAYINDNETWKPALIYINKNNSNPSLDPDWELVDMAEFLNNN